MIPEKAPIPIPAAGDDQVIRSRAQPVVDRPVEPASVEGADIAGRAAVRQISEERRRAADGRPRVELDGIDPGTRVRGLVDRPSAGVQRGDERRVGQWRVDDEQRIVVADRDQSKTDARFGGGLAPRVLGRNSANQNSTRCTDG